MTGATSDRSVDAQTAWVAVDWGTSNVRLWGVAQDGAATFSRSSDKGMSRLTPGEYPGVLAELVGYSDLGSTEVLICGMAGARQGWQEAPYLDTPADLSRLAADGVHLPPVGRFQPTILPGVCHRVPGAEDVMRGEETQLLGLSRLIPGFSGAVVMPGTHSKWAWLEATTLTRFSTVMTGELFEVLSRHSVLRHSLTDTPDPAERDAGFQAGVRAGLDNPAQLTATLFKVRAGSLLSGRTPAWNNGFLSGLLIGTEIGAQRDLLSDNAPVPLVGSAGLCALYARAFAAAGLATRIVDATEATLAGLKAARERI